MQTLSTNLTNNGDLTVLGGWAWREVGVYKRVQLPSFIMKVNNYSEK